MRQSNIGLLNYLLGFNQPGTPWNPQTQQPQQPMGPMGGGPQGNGWGYTPGQAGRQVGPQQNGIGGGMPGSMHPSFSMGGMSPQGMGGAGYGGPEPGLRPGGNGALAGMLGGGGGGLPMPGRMVGVGNDSMNFNPAGMGLIGGGVAQGGPQGSPLQRGNAAAQFGQMPNIGASMPGSPMAAYGQQAGGGFSTQLPQTQSDPNSPLGRMESYFGPLGTPTTALQQQSMGGMSQFLNSNPYGQSNNALSQIMGTQGHDYFGGAQNAFNKVGNANYFGAASGQANKVAGANYFGGAQGAFNKLQGGNYYGDAKNAFTQLGNYNPFQPAQHALEGMFGQNPGQGVVDASMPMYERALAEANQEGGRFGSANAIMRSHALDDFNLRNQQALQEGVNQQINAAGQYGQMGNSLIGAKSAAGQGLLGVGQGQMQQQSEAANGLLGIGQGQLQQGLGAGQLMLGVGQGQLQQGLGAAQGMLGVGQGRSSYGLGLMGNQINAAGQLANNQNSMFNNLTGAYGVGSQQAGQEAQRQQQALQILSGLLGTSQSATLGGPTVVSPTGAQQGAQMGGSLAQILAAYGGGGGSPMPSPGAGGGAWSEIPSGTNGGYGSFGIPYGF